MSGAPVLRRRLNALSALSLALVLAACNSTAPAGAPAPVLGAPGLTPVAAVGAAPTAPPAAGTDAPPSVVTPLAETSLSGLAMLPDGPFAGATVTAYLPNQATPLATATAGPDGAFTLSLGADAAGKLLKIVANKGETTLVGAAYVSGAPASAQRRLLDVDALRLDLGTTIAYLTLAARYTAVAQAALRSEDAASAVAALNLAANAARKASAILSKKEITDLFTGVGSNGQGSIPASLASRLAPVRSALAQTLVDSALTLNALLRAQQSSGATSGTGLDLDKVVFAGTVIFGAKSNGGSGGGSNSNDVADGTVSVVGEDALFTGNVDPLTGTATADTGDIIDRFGVDNPLEMMVSDGEDGVWVARDNQTLVHLTPLADAVMMSVDAEPTRLVADGSGGVWVAHLADDSVSHVTDDGVTTFAVADAPAALAANGTAGVWVANSGSNSVSHITTAGTVTTAAVTIASPDLLTSDGAGGVWVSHLNGTALEHLTPPSPLTSTTYTLGAAIKSLAPGGADSGVWASTATGLTRVVGADQPAYVTGATNLGAVADGLGGVWVYDNVLDRVIHIDKFGIQVTADVPSGGRSLAADDSGDVWLVTDTGVTLIDLTGLSTDLTNIALGSSGTARVVSADASGNAWVLGNNAVVYEVAR